MWRSLTAVARYPASLGRTVAQAWNTFWYTAADPMLLGVIRIMTGLMLLYTHAVWGLALDEFFGRDAWISRDLADLTLKDQFAFSFWWSVPPNWIWVAYAAAMLVLALFAIGLFTRIASILALAVVISFVNRQPEALFGLDKINLVLTFYLTVGPSGAALSLDRFLVRLRGIDPAPIQRSVGANFTVRLIQVHMCIVYFFAGISKFQGPAWWNGQAMWLAFGNLEYQSIDMTWLA
jgi:Vitamin K-dependent gamma-carboxylase